MDGKAYMWLGLKERGPIAFKFIYYPPQIWVRQISLFVSLQLLILKSRDFCPRSSTTVPTNHTQEK